MTVGDDLRTICRVLQKTRSSQESPPRLEELAANCGMDVSRFKTALKEGESLEFLRFDQESSTITPGPRLPNSQSEGTGSPGLDDALKKLSDPKDSQEMSEGNAIRSLIAKLVASLGAILFIGGVIVAIVGRSAETTLTLFGQVFSSTSVGVALAFIGAVIVALTFRRVLRSLDRSEKKMK